MGACARRWPAYCWQNCHASTALRRASQPSIYNASFGGACPDLAFTLEDGRLVLVENKLDAPETHGLMAAGSDTALGPIRAPQLRRYISLSGVSALAFIRATRKPVEAAVLANPRYLRPAGGAQHFLWRDLYPLLEGSAHPITQWLRGAFEACDFTPPTDAVGDLTDPERRRNVRKLLDSTADLARTLGWAVGGGSIAELWLQYHPTSPTDLVWVNPTTERLLVRLRPRSPENLHTVRLAAAVAQTALEATFPVELTQLRVPQKAGLCDVVDLSVPMSALIAEATTAAALEARFKRFIEPIVRAVSPSAPA